MSTSKKLAVAALAGLLSTSFVSVANAETAPVKDAVKAVETKEKHACKGKASCAADAKKEIKAH